MCVLAAAGEGPRFDPACAECCCNLWSSSRYFTGFIPLHRWNVSGSDVWVAVDVVVAIVDVRVAVVVAVEVASQSQRASSLMSVCTAAEEDATGCRSTEPLGITGGSSFALWLLSASVGAEWERLVCLLPPAPILHCLHRYV